MILHDAHLLGIVKKHRMLYMVGQTRVHIDKVEGLGHYLELEVIKIVDLAWVSGPHIPIPRVPLLDYELLPIQICPDELL